MANKDAKAPGLDDREKVPVPTNEAQRTDEAQDVVVLDPEDSLPPGVTPDSAVTVVDDQRDDEVYVILPEGDTSEIPVVETEALDDASETGDIAASETMTLDQDVPPGTDTESILQNTTQFADQDLDPVESRETQNLEELATELEDQVLAEAAGNTSEMVAIPVPADDVLGSDGSAGMESIDSHDGSHAPVQISAGRRFFRVVLAAAAVLTLSAVGIWYMGGFGDFQPFHVASTASSGGSHATSLPQPPVDTGAGGTTTPADPAGNSPGGEGAAQEEARLALKQAFRGKLVAALDLGFGGEVKHE